jgi:hypothetical protein
MKLSDGLKNARKKWPAPLNHFMERIWMQPTATAILGRTYAINGRHAGNVVLVKGKWSASAPDEALQTDAFDTMEEAMQFVERAVAKYVEAHPTAFEPPIVEAAPAPSSMPHSTLS